MGEEVNFLFLTPPAGFLDVRAPVRRYSVSEISAEAIAIYIASATKADEVTKGKVKIIEYVDSMIRVIPEGIGIESMIQKLSNITVKVVYWEHYDDPGLQCSIKFSPDLLEVIAVIPSDSELLKREYSDYWEYFEPVITELEKKGKYIEVFK